MEPPQGSGAKPLVREVTGEKPPEYEKLLAFGHSMEVANFLTFLKFENAGNHRYLCCLSKDRTTSHHAPPPKYATGYT